MTNCRRVVFSVLGIVAVLGVVTVCSAAPWPSSLSYSIGLSSAEEAPLQMTAALEGKFTDRWGAKLGGWWVTGGSDSHAFLGDAYLDYTGESLYLAGGRKFVPFGPSGVLVSPGIAGGEGRFHSDRITVQAIAGTLAFTPLIGETRFAFGGGPAPADEPVRAARVAVELTDPKAEQHTIIGGNWLDVMDDTGASADISVGVNPWLTVFGESARFADESAYAYGIRFTNEHTSSTPGKYTSVTVYGRKIPIGYVPASVGAANYFEGQKGMAVGMYHQVTPNYGVGLFADRNDAIVSLFGFVPLR